MQGHRSIRWASDNPTHRCQSNGVHWEQATWNESSGTGWTDGAKLERRSIDRRIDQSRCQVSWNRVLSTGWSDGHWANTSVYPVTLASLVRRPNGYFRAQCDRMNRCPTVGLSGACAEKWPTALNG
jgi:hypothetical protein